MEPCFYLQLLFPTFTEEELNEQIFALTYLMKGGISYESTLEMSRRERIWFLRRITEQKRDEAQQIQRAKGNT
jgi:hypothetical protein